VVCGAAGGGPRSPGLHRLFRNPLATPFTLGVASGAAFGVALATRLGLAAAFLGLATDSLAALAGALVAVSVVWLLTRARPASSSMVLLLAGVAMSFFFSSLILLLQYTASLGDSYQIVRWLMGGLAGVGTREVLHLLPFVAVGVVALLWRARELDLLSIGADLAASRGVDVGHQRTVIFLAASVMVGGVVAACGPIGFVGMMAPHICRLLLGAGHRHLLPASCLFGGAFLAVCDTAARLVLAPAELPVGVITAFLGGPFFLWLLAVCRGGSSPRNMRLRRSASRHQRAPPSPRRHFRPGHFRCCRQVAHLAISTPDCRQRPGRGRKCHGGTPVEGHLGSGNGNPFDLAAPRRCLPRQPPGADTYGIGFVLHYAVTGGEGTETETARRRQALWPEAGEAPRQRRRGSTRPRRSG
jgi:iron complex transport system permease protein